MLIPDIYNLAANMNWTLKQLDVKNSSSVMRGLHGCSPGLGAYQLMDRKKQDSLLIVPNK